MKLFKLNKRNKKELVGISVSLFAIIMVFVWVAENIGLPINTFIKHGRVQVIDVSVYNGNVNWKRVKDKKINHAVLRIGSGINEKRKGSEDQKFGKNYRSAKLASIRVGVYYYSYAKTVDQAKAEAKHCLQMLDKYEIDPDDLTLPVAYDMEEDSVMATGKENVTRLAVAFLEEIKKAGYVPMIYSGASNLRNNFQYRKIKDYKIWVAHYTKKKAPAIPFSYHMWQYSESGSVPGANTSSGNCDLNYYLVDKEGKLL